MKIIHSFNKKEVQKEIPDSTSDLANPGFLLTNKKGGFLFLCARENFSRYNGSYFPVETPNGWVMFKAIEAIRLVGRVTDTLKNNIFNVERLSQNTTERFWMNHSSTIIYEVENFNGYSELVLDSRHMFDFGDMGRIYKITKEDDLLVIEYSKYYNAELKDINYKVYVVIAGVAGYLENNSWEKAFYPYDKKRGSHPSEYFVYNALKLQIDGNAKFIFTYSNSKEEAILLAKNAKNNTEPMKRSLEKYKKSILQSEFCATDEKIDIALKCAVSSVDSLITTIGDKKGIYAGIPWFHQFWTRDEAITLKSLIIEERYEEAKEILIRLLNLMLPDGRLSNRYPIANLGSADSVGWTFKRIDELLDLIESKAMHKWFFSNEELVFIKKRLKFAIENILREKVANGLVKNDKLETWMDTYYRDDFREGFCIEIQALQLAMYKLMARFCQMSKNNVKYESYRKLEEATREKVRESFWKKPILYDRLNDETVRPNIFLAHYIYPELLEKSDWEKCFDYTLPKIWLPWGGVATIDKNNPIFSERYTGENNKSYHRGDSWFFINNIAAISMNNLNKKKYQSQIAKIIEASTEEILFKGIIGHHAELSSAEELRSEGSPCQAWSAATYIEMINAILSVKK